jgi:hypothetical protein
LATGLSFLLANFCSVAFLWGVGDGASSMLINKEATKGFIIPQKNQLFFNTDAQDKVIVEWLYAYFITFLILGILI